MMRMLAETLACVSAGAIIGWSLCGLIMAKKIDVLHEKYHAMIKEFEKTFDELEFYPQPKHPHHTTMEAQRVRHDDRFF